PRRRDRERRAAVDQIRPRVLAGEPAVGDLRLRNPLRRRPAARRAARRPARPPAAVRRGASTLRLELTPLRPRLVGGLADRVPRVAGPRRRAARTGCPLPADDDLRRGP